MQIDLFENWYSDDSLRAAVEESIFIVAVAKCSIIGFIQLTPNQARGHKIRRMYVIPQHQRCGIGTRLLEHALCVAGPGTVGAIVEEQNEKGRQFYERRGFSLVDKRMMNFFGYGLPVITYHKA
jgi:GNAT superfamily N-acetyltransferase